MARNASGSIPKQMVDFASTKAAYRFFGMPETTHSAICSPHWEATRAQARVPGLGVVLFVQDLTELDFGILPDSMELGFVGSTLGRGFEVQTTLCVVPSAPKATRPEVLGIAMQSPWVRDHAPRQKIESVHARTKRRTEYDVWRESVETIGPAPNSDSGTLWVTVGDRGSDIFSHLAAAHALGWRCLVRSKHDRKLVQASEELGSLHKRVRSLEAMGTTTLHLRSRPGVPARTAALNVAATAVTLPGTYKSARYPALDVACVRVWEEPKAGLGSPIEWILLTTLPADSFEEVLTLVHYYRHRWLVEEYHKCLKSGCKMETRSLNHRDRLLPLLGVLSIVAVLLLQLKAPGHQDKPPEELIQIVRLVTKAKEDLSTSQALLRRIAMLGGFLGRKGDGEPGWLAVWDGWKRIQDILIGIEIARQMNCG